MEQSQSTSDDAQETSANAWQTISRKDASQADTERVDAPPASSGKVTKVRHTLGSPTTPVAPATLLEHATNDLVGSLMAGQQTYGYPAHLPFSKHCQEYISQFTVLGFCRLSVGTFPLHWAYTHVNTIEGDGHCRIHS